MFRKPTHLGNRLSGRNIKYVLKLVDLMEIFEFPENLRFQCHMGIRIYRENPTINTISSVLLIMPSQWSDGVCQDSGYLIFKGKLYIYTIQVYFVIKIFEKFYNHV